MWRSKLGELRNVRLHIFHEPHYSNERLTMFHLLMSNCEFFSFSVLQRIHSILNYLEPFLSWMREKLRSIEIKKCTTLQKRCQKPASIEFYRRSARQEKSPLASSFLVNYDLLKKKNLNATSIVIFLCFWILFYSIFMFLNPILFSWYNWRFLEPSKNWLASAINTHHKKP